jgi:hypothetical protein
VERYPRARIGQGGRLAACSVRFVAGSCGAIDQEWSPSGVGDRGEGNAQTVGDIVPPHLQRETER